MIPINQRMSAQTSSKKRKYPKSKTGKRPLTHADTEDAKAFIDELGNLPQHEYEASRLLVMGFMTALDKNQS